MTYLKSCFAKITNFLDLILNMTAVNFLFLNITDVKILTEYVCFIKYRSSGCFKKKT